MKKLGPGKLLAADHVSETKRRFKALFYGKKP